MARPGTAIGPAPTGTFPLGMGQTRDGVLYVPPSYHPGQPAPLAVMLHGAGGNAQHSLTLLQPYADATEMIILVPESQGRTWDVILGDYGPDSTFIDRALAQTFAHYAIDPRRVAVGGFSDGASYALSLGIINGDLFTHIIAYSPGFMAPTMQRGTPQIFMSHGVHDTVLPIQRCSRRLVPHLQQAGYTVVYREFDGPHTVPPDIAQQAVDWFITVS